MLEKITSLETRAHRVSVVSGHSSLNAVHELFTKRLSGKTVRIYEAGGGSASFIKRDILNRAKVTVLDIDEVQLQKNSYADEKILGDIQTYAFPHNSFELIVCYNVVEHLHAPDKAISLFYEALVPGGLLFIGAPNPNSFSGLITKLTPHWFHILYYKFVLGYKSAGEPGNVPFRTVYHPVVSPNALNQYCEKLGFRVLYFKEYQGDLLRQLTEKRPILGKLLNVFISCANALILWKRDLRDGDFHIVLEKPTAAKNASHSSLIGIGLD